MQEITILTVTFNSADTLADCIESVHSQTQAIEHIVIDGGSSDTSLDILKKYEARLSRVISEPDRGLFDGLNKGIKFATGDIIGCLHADDLYHDENVLHKIVDAFNDPEVDACYGDLVFVDPVNIKKVVRYWKAGAYARKKFLYGWMPPHTTFFVRRSVFEKHGLYNLEMGTAADYEIMLRFLFKHQVQTVYIPEVLVHMRTGGMSNASIRNRLKANRMDRKAWKVNDLQPYPWTLIAKPLSKLKQWIIKKQV